MGNLTRIAVIYDGNYLQIVSNYYNYDHPRQSYLSIRGLHEYIRNEVADFEDTDLELCKIVDSHYFRGRMWASELAQNHPNRFYRERVFEDILMAENVTTHFLPLRHVGQGRREEKGIDVWLALETYELAVLKKYDVIALVAADVDYVPLVRKLNALGTRVMMLGWDFETMTEYGDRRLTRYSRDLAEEASYTIPMQEDIEEGLLANDPLVQKLFVREDPRFAKATERLEKEKKTSAAPYRPARTKEEIEALGPFERGKVLKIFPQGYGFIDKPPLNVFFHRAHLVEGEWQELVIGGEIEYQLDTELSNDEKLVAQTVRPLRD